MIRRQKTGSGGINPDDINPVTNGAAADALKSALEAGKSPEEALKLAEEAASAALRASQATSGGSEAVEAQEEATEAQDNPTGDDQELTDEQLDALRLRHQQHDAYLTACLDIAHGQFEYLDLDRKRRAAAAIVHNVVSFEEWSKRLGL